MNSRICLLPFIFKVQSLSPSLHENKLSIEEKRGLLSTFDKNAVLHKIKIVNPTSSELLSQSQSHFHRGRKMYFHFAAECHMNNIFFFFPREHYRQMGTGKCISSAALEVTNKTWRKNNELVTRTATRTLVRASRVTTY